MYFIKRKILRFFYRLLRKNPNKMPMVQYWKVRESIPAKVTLSKKGETIMRMEGEAQAFPGFPRGHLLFGSLSKLKHEIKNQIFNESWRKLEEGREIKQIIPEAKEAFDRTAVLLEEHHYDMIPPARMVEPVREIWRAMSTIEKGHPRVAALKKMICHIFSEDDAYRFRLQWVVSVFNPSSWWFRLFFPDPIKGFDLGLRELENAEVIGDMKDKIKLLRRILLTVLEDPNVKDLFLRLCKEMKWNKLKLSEGDKYHFRGKWFKVDYDKFEY